MRGKGGGRVTYLEDSVLAGVLVADPEHLAVLLSRPESQLDGRDETVRFEREGVFDATLRVESGRNCFLVAAGSRPSGTALAARFRQGADARSVLSAAGRGWAPEVGHPRAGYFVAGAKLIERSASGLTCLPHPRFRQIVNLQIPNPTS